MPDLEKINLISLMQRTIEKVLDTCGLERSVGATRLVASVLLNITAVYLREIDEKPEGAVALFASFMKDEAEDQKKALQTWGELGEKRGRIIVTSDGGST